MSTIVEGLTFDDVLLVPGYSEVLPGQVDVKTRFSRKIELNIPISSAAMDTVTESGLAIALAQQGGIGVIHKNFSISEQREEVEKVKRSEAGTIVDPITIQPGQKISEAKDLMRRYEISGIPVVNENGRAVGILTNRDLRFLEEDHRLVKDVMTVELITTAVGTTSDQAKTLLQEHRIEKLLVVDMDGILKGLITVKDIQKAEQFPLAVKDDRGQLLVAAAIGATGDFMERAAELIAARVDALVIDTAHGHSKDVLKAVNSLRSAHLGVQLVVGNIATEIAAQALIEAGADALKIGMGPGSICTTRVVSGAGMPQITAIQNCVKGAKGSNVPIIADGGIKFSGDITKAIAAGADSIMIGSLFAGANESPGDAFSYQGRKFKSYRGMGSIAAMKEGSASRYGQHKDAGNKLVPEGIEGQVPVKGPLSDLITQLVGGLRSGMGYTGCRDICELQTKAKFIRITSAGLKESHVHDVTMVREAPNYGGLD